MSEIVNPNLSGVPGTLLITLYIRAIESQRPDALLKDEKAEALPFKDNAFEATFHIGGINFFGDKKAAIDEMIRVAKPGTKVAVADENEKAAQSLDWLPGFGRLFEKKRDTVTTPVDLVPAAMQEIKADSIWKGTGWVVEFRKPA